MFRSKLMAIPWLGCGVLTLCLTGSAAAGVYESVSQAKQAVQNTPAISFKSAELQTACLQDLDGVNATLMVADEEAEANNKNQLRQDALNAVNNLIAKTDGCPASGNPDAEDWIINCNDAFNVKTALDQLANDVSMLIQ